MLMVGMKRKVLNLSIGINNQHDDCLMRMMMTMNDDADNCDDTDDDDKGVPPLHRDQHGQEELLQREAPPPRQHWGC